MRQLLICFDVDGTLIDDTVFIWQTLHDAIATDPEERRAWEKAFWNKEITYAEWAQHDVDMWRRKGVTRRDLMQYLTPLRPMCGANDALNALHDAGHVLGIISGSLDIALDRAFPDWKTLFRHVFLNHLIFNEQDVLMGVRATSYDIDHKADGLREMARRTGFALTDTVFIGDHFNDVSVAELAGLSIAFNCKSDLLARVADVVVDGTDLRSILPVIRNAARQD
ncbi:HAD family phosphatase [bacterium]|nr:HAD family phosphatase [candidate division CSSED10-310 bacterium]